MIVVESCRPFMILTFDFEKIRHVFSIYSIYRKDNT